MVQTRQRRCTLAKQRASAQRTLVPIPEAVRAERLAITKDIADEIVRTQDSLVGGRYGCRMDIIRKYSPIYSWLSKDQIDWHVREIKKRRSKVNSTTTTHNSNVATINTNVSDITTNLVVNDFTVDLENSTIVSF